MEPLVSWRSFHNPFFIAGLSGVEIVQQVPLLIIGKGLSSRHKLDQKTLTLDINGRGVADPIPMKNSQLFFQSI